ncbi:hypothetical protein SDC9_142146 [bioreactor metagenome]|uniref:Uncharacterized protein n=1 Tax=bioreactor metagenome TaxID=1076179 RepID=A0A645E028_9ZZZZ
MNGEFKRIAENVPVILLQIILGPEVALVFFAGFELEHRRRGRIEQLAILADPCRETFRRPLVLVDFFAAVDADYGLVDRFDAAEIDYEIDAAGEIGSGTPADRRGIEAQDVVTARGQFAVGKIGGVGVAAAGVAEIRLE